MPDTDFSLNFVCPTCGARPHEECDLKSDAPRLDVYKRQAGSERRQGSGAVVAAGVAAAQGETAAFLAAGQDLGAFGAHFFLQRETFSKKRLARTV